MDLSVLARIASEGRVFDLGQTLSADMPHHPNYPAFNLSLQYRHGDVTNASGGTFASALVYASDHHGTHVDGLGHYSANGRLTDGVDAFEIQAGGRGLSRLGIETMAPFVCRGVLLDAAGDRGTEVLRDDAVLTGRDLEEIASRERAEIRAGDAVLIRTGRGRFWDEPARYFDPARSDPGPGGDGCRWLAARSIAITGSDTTAYEALPADEGDFGVGHIALLGRGIPIVESLNLESLAAARIYEFLFVMAPLKIVGGTGSPVRPVAIA